MSGKRMAVRIATSLAVATVMATACGFVALYVAGAPNRDMNGWNDRFVSHLDEWRANPPPGVDPSEWETAVGWTQVALPNCLYDPEHIKNMEKYHEFREILMDKLEAPPSLDTITWIWEELPSVSTNAESYVKQYRPFEPLGLKHR